MIDWVYKESVTKANVCDTCGHQFSDVCGTCETLDGVPVKYSEKQKEGKWIEHREYNLDYYYTCSECGEDMYFVEGEPVDNMFNYCPYCGSKMTETIRLVEEDEE